MYAQFMEPTDIDVNMLAARMREADRAECAAGGMTPRQALRDSLDYSTLKHAVYFDGQLGCIVGVGPASGEPGLGEPWLLGTDVLTQNPAALLRVTKPYIQRMRERFPRLENFVHARNMAALRWLRAVGFDVSDTPQYPYTHEPFYRFHLGAQS